MDLNSIKSPADVKKLDVGSLRLLSEELRAVLIKKLAAHGGHCGPNLGVVEATVALHFVFDAPTDMIVFDVSHQSYVHKMLTGRMEAFTDPSHYDDVTGYTCPRESHYDLFELGHTSTSIALASGLAKARDLSGGKENVVAFIGDASLGGGEALEALDYAAQLGSNFIVVVNDNDMSIAENHGGLYDHLRHLRETDGKASDNIFRALGFGYVYVDYGNDVEELVRTFRQVKDTDHPVVVHINTMKGKGLPCAEADKESFHYTAPFNPADGAPLDNGNDEDFTDIFARRMLEMMHDDAKVCVLTAGTPGALGFTPARRKAAGERFIDVGICEQQATGMSAGLAKGGMKPVFGVMATFLQRAFDQLSQDVAINNQPVTVVTFGGGVYGVPDMTHLGFFDIPMITNIPGWIYLAPADAAEYEAMLDWAVGYTAAPVAVRTPGYPALKEARRPVTGDFNPLRYEVVEDGEDIAVIAEGTMLGLGRKATALMRKRGLKPMLINPRVISDVDAECLDRLRGFSHVITIEDGIVDGGFGQKVAAYLADSPVRVHVEGLRKEFLDRYRPSEVLADNGLTPEKIAALSSPSCSGVYQST